MPALPSLKFFKNIAVSPAVPAEVLNQYAYLLTVCEFPASVSYGKLFWNVVDLCRWNIKRVRTELYNRFEKASNDTASDINAIMTLFGNGLIYKTLTKKRDEIAASWCGENNRNIMMCVLGSLENRSDRKPCSLLMKMSVWIGERLDSGDTLDLLFYEATYRLALALPTKHWGMQQEWAFTYPALKKNTPSLLPHTGRPQKNTPSSDLIPKIKTHWTFR